jgi:hypothetical protein
MNKARVEEPVWRFPFIGMGVGESFFIPTNSTEFLTYKVRTAAKEFGIKVVIRTRVEEDILGIRVWRMD